MYKLIAVSDRHICRGDFYERIKEIISWNTDIILREKDLSEHEYKLLLDKFQYKQLIPHTFIAQAELAGFEKIHLPLSVLCGNPHTVDKFYVSTSVHSAEEARKAESLGAAAVTAGHVFSTDCKKGLTGRGLSFIEDVKNAVKIPVYAIGGIKPQNIRDVINAGADGVCIMSGFMQCEDVGEFIKEIRNMYLK